MENILSYVEPHPDTGSEEQVNFKWICPKSFKIAKHQAGTLKNPGLSLVAFIESDDLNNMLRDFCSDIENYHFFTDR
jgi:hypothetical protein